MSLLSTSLDVNAITLVTQIVWSSSHHPLFTYHVPHQQNSRILVEMSTISQLKPIYWAKKPAKSRIGIEPVLYIMNCSEKTRPRTASGVCTCIIVCVGIFTQAIATPSTNTSAIVVQSNNAEPAACPRAQ